MHEEHDDPQGDFLKGFKLALSVGLCLVVLGAAIGVGKLVGLAFDDANDAVLTSKIVLEAKERERLWLSHPLCKETMTTSVAGIVDHYGCYTGK